MGNRDKETAGIKSPVKYSFKCLFPHELHIYYVCARFHYTDFFWLHVFPGTAVVMHTIGFWSEGAEHESNKRHFQCYRHFYLKFLKFLKPVSHQTFTGFIHVSVF